jgi:hypothetical protein
VPALQDVHNDALADSELYVPDVQFEHTDVLPDVVLYVPAPHWKQNIGVLIEKYSSPIIYSPGCPVGPVVHLMHNEFISGTDMGIETNPKLYSIAGHGVGPEPSDVVHV